MQLYLPFGSRSDLCREGRARVAGAKSPNPRAARNFCWAPCVRRATMRQNTSVQKSLDGFPSLHDATIEATLFSLARAGMAPNVEFT